LSFAVDAKGSDEFSGDFSSCLDTDLVDDVRGHVNAREGRSSVLGNIIKDSGVGKTRRILVPKEEEKKKDQRTNEYEGVTMMIRWEAF
jgi:hypothetical protein